MGLIQQEIQISLKTSCLQVKNIHLSVLTVSEPPVQFLEFGVSDTSSHLSPSRIFIMPWKGEAHILTDFNAKTYFPYQVNSKPFLEQVNLRTKFWPVGQGPQDRNIGGKAKCHSHLKCGINKQYWRKVKLHWKSSLLLVQTRSSLCSERNKWSLVSYGFVPHGWILWCLVKYKPHLKVFLAFQAFRPSLPHGVSSSEVMEHVKECFFFWTAMPFH